MSGDLTSAVNLLKITCAICKKPVEEICMTHSLMEDSYLLQVKCHGDIDSMILERRTLFCEGVSFLCQPGEAFKTKRIQEVFKESDNESLIQSINDEQIAIDSLSMACPEASDRRHVSTGTFLKDEK